MSTPYQRIAAAHRRGTSCRLTAFEVQRLMMDTAIIDRARLDDEDDEQARLDKQADDDAQRYADSMENNSPRCVW